MDAPVERPPQAPPRDDAPVERPPQAPPRDASNGHRPESAARARARAAAARVHGVPVDEPREPHYGGLVTRTIAFVVDAAIIDAVAALTGAAVALVLSLLTNTHKHQTTLVAIGGVVFAIWAVAYFVTFWATTGQTPGSRLMRLRVTRAGGGSLRPRHALVRAPALIAAIIPLGAGIVPILFTRRRRGFQDWAAGTVVVTAARRPGPEA